MLDLNNRVVLISGANRGIGLALATRLYEAGCFLSLGARDPESLVSFLADKNKARVHVARYEATDWTSHELWVSAALEQFGKIDALINNAGIGSHQTIRTISETELDAVWAVNCKAPLHMIQLALPHLEQSGSGRVINIASLSGKRVRNDHIAYTMSKFAVLALSHSTRRIGWESGVRCTALCPSFVLTDMTRGSDKIKEADMIDPKDLAELATTLLTLPNTASVAEIMVNCRLEDMF
jgi:NAD(P)-dependent dehydrogenase (short-subunit alcohol dehydrogenase family)